MRDSRPISLCLGLLAGTVMAGCGGRASTPPAGAPTVSVTISTASTQTAASTPTAAPAPTGAAVRPRRVRHPARTVDPGTLPQTDALPSAHTAAFAARMRALWRAIQMDAPDVARPAFFPETAYVRLKAVPDARSDFEDRLFADFRLDVAAAHALLGSQAPHARLVAVDVPGEDVHWVGPDVCLNRDGYYEVPNARIVYSADGATRSFGIASMISWRGVWYVVHLGAVTRKVVTGIVDDPSAGPGVSAPSSTC